MRLRLAPGTWSRRRVPASASPAAPAAHWRMATDRSGGRSADLGSSTFTCRHPPRASSAGASPGASPGASKGPRGRVDVSVLPRGAVRCLPTRPLTDVLVLRPRLWASADPTGELVAAGAPRCLAAQRAQIPQVAAVRRRASAEGETRRLCRPPPPRSAAQRSSEARVGTTGGARFPYALSLFTHWVHVWSVSGGLNLPSIRGNSPYLCEGYPCSNSAKRGTPHDVAAGHDALVGYGEAGHRGTGVRLCRCGC